MTDNEIIRLRRELETYKAEVQRTVIELGQAIDQLKLRVENLETKK